MDAACQSTFGNIPRVMLTLLPILFGTQVTAEMPPPVPADIAWEAEGGFCEPETVIPLPDDTLLVSNVCGFSEKGTGFLSLLNGDGDVIDWRILDDLDSPLGMALQNGLLYIVDDNRVKTFRWPGFDPVSTIALETAVANDIAIGPDDAIYVTDTSLGKVVVVLPGLEQFVLIGAGRFPGANGIHIRGDNMYVGGEALWHIDLVELEVTTIGPTWLTDIDGIEQEADGTLQVTPVSGPLIRLDDQLAVLGGDGVSSANHGYSERLGLALIPTGFDNTVIAIRLGN